MSNVLLNHWRFTLISSFSWALDLISTLCLIGNVDLFLLVQNCNIGSALTNLLIANVEINHLWQHVMAEHLFINLETAFKLILILNLKEIEFSFVSKDALFGKNRLFDTFKETTVHSCKRSDCMCQVLAFIVSPTLKNIQKYELIPLKCWNKHDRYSDIPDTHKMHFIKYTGNVI